MAGRTARCPGLVVISAVGRYTYPTTARLCLVGLTFPQTLYRPYKQLVDMDAKDILGIILKEMPSEKKPRSQKDSHRKPGGVSHEASLFLSSQISFSLAVADIRFCVVIGKNASSTFPTF
ncbi:hypothetical protein ACLOJK_019030 [Asimina triloba]